jgi:hypothetical protein
MECALGEHEPSSRDGAEESGVGATAAGLILSSPIGYELTGARRSARRLIARGTS